MWNLVSHIFAYNVNGNGKIFIQMDISVNFTSVNVYVMELCTSIINQCRTYRKYVSYLYHAQIPTRSMQVCLRVVDMPFQNGKCDTIHCIYRAPEQQSIHMSPHKAGLIQDRVIIYSKRALKPTSVRHKLEDMPLRNQTIKHVSS